MAFTDIYVYTSEVVPTEVRNIGMGTSSVCARLSGMAAPYIGGILVLLSFVIWFNLIVSSLSPSIVQYVIAININYLLL